MIRLVVSFRSRAAYLQVGEATKLAATTSSVAPSPLRQPMGRGKLYRPVSHNAHESLQRPDKDLY